MNKKAGLIAISLCVAATAACSNPEKKAAEDAAKQLEEATKNLEQASKTGTANVGDAMAAMGAVINSANAGKKVETVDFRELKNLLPGDLPGMKRTEATGERAGAMGMMVATAKGRYSNDQGSSVTVNITDIGSMTGLAGMAAAAWATTEIDRESDGGYEKTTKFNGYKALEKYNNGSKSGEISVLVGDRFIVAAEGNGVDMNALKGTIGKVDLDKLNGWKTRGVQ